MPLKVRYDVLQQNETRRSTDRFAGDPVDAVVAVMNLISLYGGRRVAGVFQLDGRDESQVAEVNL